jgi:hypothetical protein
MKTPVRILITATTLAALTTLGLAATATASVPTPPRGQQHPTTTVEPGTVPHPGHGAQLHHDAHDTGPATANQSPTDATTSADYATSSRLTAPPTL